VQRLFSKARIAESVLGYMRTFRDILIMSALPPNADIDRQLFDVREVPEADIRALRPFRISNTN
jgi:hypothetical protein